MFLTDVDGTTKQSFQIGYIDPVKLVSSSVPSEEDDSTQRYLEIGAKIKVDGVETENPISTSADPVGEDDVVNLKALTLRITNAIQQANDYTDNSIKELTGGTTGANVMLLPIQLTADDMIDGYSVAFGKLAANKFVDRIIFEVTEGFSTDELYDISIGTVTKPEAFVPKFSTDKLASTYIINVCRTMETESDFVLYVSKHPDPVEPEPDPEPEPGFVFEQKIINEHEGVSTSITSDASEKVWSITLTGDDLNAQILDTETFGTVDGAVMDFALNFPTDNTHRYRVVQRNPALQYFSDDPYIGESGGIYTKDKNYTLSEEDEEMIYKFAVTESTGDSDYIHIWVYDLDGEDPENAILTYHIKNNLTFKGSSGAGAILQHDFMSASEGSVGIVKNAENQYTVTLDGEIHSKESLVTQTYPDLSGNLTAFGVYYPRAIPETGLRLAVYNPAYASLDGIDQTVHCTNGVYYAEMYVYYNEEAEGFWIDLPVSDDKSYPIVITVIDPESNESFLVGIDNNLTFLPEETEEEVEESSDDDSMMPAAYNLEPMAASEDAEAEDSDIGGETEEPQVTPTGKARVRILSF